MKLPSSLTVRRFRIEGAPIDPERALALLEKRRFAVDLPVPTEGDLKGWVSFGNFLDANPDASWIAGGRLFFGLRIDKRKPNSALLRAKCAMEEKIRKEASGKAVLPARIRKEIKEEIARDIADATPPSHSHYAAIWQFHRQEIHLLSGSESVADVFREEFRVTFDRKLTTLRPAWRARTLDIPASSVSALDSYHPVSFAGSHDLEPPVDEFELHRHLGREFLTWLWYRIEETGGDFQWPDLGRYGMMVGESLVLDGDELDATKDSFRGGAPAEAVEAGTALAAAKKVAQMRLLVARDEAEWRGTISAATLDVGGLKLPKTDSKDIHEILDDQLSGLEEWIKVQDRLFKEFLTIRLGPDCRQHVEAVRTWVASHRGEPVMA